ncbi:MAG: CmpA/NrtA family ABC transporter substrate-binding protein [Sulfuricurvum sp.]
MKGLNVLGKSALVLSMAAVMAMAAPEKKDIKIGFIALTDCAPIVIAKEKGFFAKHGLNVDVVKEGGGWAGIQQKVISGEYDYSHALAGMPLAATIGISGNTPMYALLSLDYNGNAITFGNSVIDEMEKYGLDSVKRPVSSVSLKKLIDAKRAAEGSKFKPLDFGMVFPVSTHNYEIRYWMAASGIDPDADTTLKVVPPPQMVANLQAGNIDGYCVGEPWNERAVMSNLGSSLVTNYDIWNNNPEKVLMSTKAFADKNPETTQAVMEAIIEAQKWLDASWNNRKEASDILSRKQYVNAPKDVIDNSMTGTFQYLKGKPTEPNPMFNVFANYYASYPFYSHGMWFLTQMVRWGQIDKPIDMKKTVEAVYRPDLFAKAAKNVGYTLPASPWKIDGKDQYNKFIDGKVFDPNKAVDYIYDTGVNHAKVSKSAMAKANKWKVKTAQPAYVCPYGPAGCANPKFVK